MGRALVPLYLGREFPVVAAGPCRHPLPHRHPECTFEGLLEVRIGRPEGAEPGRAELLHKVLEEKLLMLSEVRPTPPPEAEEVDRRSFHVPGKLGPIVSPCGESIPRRREGGPAELERAGRALGFDIEQVGSVFVGDERVSSTAIRSACMAGDMALASRLLGRPYRMSGKVVRGERVGRTLGYPTANVDLRRRQSPVMGIFAVRVAGLADQPLDGVASVGSRPTFNGSKPLLEVHLFDFDEDIYGRYIHVDFIARLREQVRYDRVDDLVAQMHRDADNARSVLADTAV
jgi:hypothetical protein